VVDADVILHVRDVANPDHAAQAQDVLKVLGDLGVSSEQVPILEVWNKVDLLPVDEDGNRILEVTAAGKIAAAVPVSAQTGEGLETLRLEIEKALATRSRIYRVRIQHAAGADVGWLYGHAEIINREEPDEEGQTYEVRVEPRHTLAFAERFGSRIQSQA
jgi:GTP-binding protein HflX